jgi:uncharacterized protein YggE
MADARDKAEKLASLADVRLGKPTYISEGSVYVPRAYPQAMYDEAYAAGAPTTAISPGELEISLSVQVAYRILD